MHTRFLIDGGFGGTRTHKSGLKLAKPRNPACKKAKTGIALLNKNFQFPSVIFNYFKHLCFPRLPVPHLFKICSFCSKTCFSISVSCMACMTSRTLQNRNLQGILASRAQIMAEATKPENQYDLNVNPEKRGVKLAKPTTREIPKSLLKTMGFSRIHYRLFLKRKEPLPDEIFRY